MRLTHLVSIHAPAGGATGGDRYGLQPSSGFNPRTRRGCDYIGISISQATLVSIHAPAGGATYVT